MGDDTNIVPCLHRAALGQRIIGTVGVGVVPVLGAHKGYREVSEAPQIPDRVMAEYVTVIMKLLTK
ncbi:MAG: hypothetical protein AB1733_05895 [Thermodesulfobacteriota bacterium]